MYKQAVDVSINNLIIRGTNRNSVILDGESKLINGLFEYSYGSGSPDAGFYVGGCNPCNVLLNHGVNEFNGLGCSRTNSGGNLVIANSTFRNNRVGIVPNTGSYEKCYPERGGVIVGSLVHDNNYDSGTAIDMRRRPRRCRLWHGRVGCPRTFPTRLPRSARRTARFNSASRSCRAGMAPMCRQPTSPATGISSRLGSHNG